MNKEEFITAYKYRLTGLVLFQAASEVKDGLLTRAAKIHDVPALVERLLAEMYNAAVPPVMDPLNVSPIKLNGNGHHPRK